MRYIGVTMRVDIHSDISERRDALDQRWYRFLKKSNLFPILLPNCEDSFKLIQKWPLQGILLTGGNSLVESGGNAPERDMFEINLLDCAIEKKIPILGVCRGMQIIQNYFGISLQPIVNHVAVRHKVNYKGVQLEVNSYHNHGTYDTVFKLNVVGVAKDKIIEAIEHISLPIKGIMWHPEREPVFTAHDKQIFKQHFLL